MHREDTEPPNILSVPMTYKPSSQQGGHQSHLRPSPSWIGFHGSCSPFQPLSLFGSCSLLAELREGLSLLSWCWSVGWVMVGKLTGSREGEVSVEENSCQTPHWSEAWISSLHPLSSSHPLHPCSGTPDILDNTVTAWGCAQFVIYCGPVCVCCCGWPIDKWS